MRGTALRLGSRGKQWVDEDIPKEVPKPFTVPPGYTPPTLAEQWRYAALRHPYSRYGAVGAVIMGAIGYALATGQHKDAGKAGGGGQRQAGSA
jgi:hypothetical protein